MTEKGGPMRYMAFCAVLLATAVLKELSPPPWHELWKAASADHFGPAR